MAQIDAHDSWAEKRKKSFQRRGREGRDQDWVIKGPGQEERGTGTIQIKEPRQKQGEMEEAGREQVKYM